MSPMPGRASKPQTDAFRAQAISLARSGAYQSFVQIGAELEAEGFKGAIRLLGADNDLKHALNQYCVEAHEPAPHAKRR